MPRPPVERRNLSFELTPYGYGEGSADGEGSGAGRRPPRCTLWLNSWKCVPRSEAAELTASARELRAKATRLQRTRTGPQRLSTLRIVQYWVLQCVVTAHEHIRGSSFSSDRAFPRRMSRSRHKKSNSNPQAVEVATAGCANHSSTRALWFDLPEEQCGRLIRAQSAREALAPILYIRTRYDSYSLLRRRSQASVALPRAFRIFTKHRSTKLSNLVVFSFSLQIFGHFRNFLIAVELEERLLFLLSHPRKVLSHPTNSLNRYAFARTCVLYGYYLLVGSP